MSQFRPITRYISEMVEDRWVHAARRLTSIEFSFDPCNIYRGGPRAQATQLTHVQLAIAIVLVINDLDDGVINKILKFADDTKIVSKVGSEDEVRVLQSDLNKMFYKVSGLANAI